MKYEDLKESFKFKTQDGKSVWTYIADKKSKHIWNVSTENSDTVSDWDCEDMLDHLNSGAWVIQDEKETEKVVENVVEEVSVQQAQGVPEVKALRDELIIAVLPVVCANYFNEQNPTSGWIGMIAEDTLAIVDAVMEARNKGRTKDSVGF